MTLPVWFMVWAAGSVMALTIVAIISEEADDDSEVEYWEDVDLDE